MTFRCGDIVLVPFPFTDLSAHKRRPALLLKPLGEFGDWLCLPVTTQGNHTASTALRHTDFSDGILAHTSWVRTNRPTLLSESIMLGRIGRLNSEAMTGINHSLCQTLGCDGHRVMEAPAATYTPV